MKTYFENPEIKISSIIISILMSIFLVLQIGIIKIDNYRLKDDYIKTIGAITVRVISKNPQLEEEIISIVTKGITEEEGDRGKIVLAQYGLSQTLENELFPYMNSTIKKNNTFVIGIYIAMTLVICIFNYFQYGIFYKRIRIITRSAKKVIDGDYNLNINENKEGDFSKLASSFNSMKEIIRSNIDELNSDKKFLVNLLSDISHQLKTPLSSMIIYNDIMINKDLSKEQREEFLIHNKSQLNRMQWLIQNMLKLARLDAKAIDLEKNHQSLNETVKEVIDTLKSKANQGKVMINLTEKSEVILEHDRLWMEEALINIVKNAIEHTEEGGVINIEISENLIYKRIVVEDTGEGIRKEDLPNIFKRFYKVKTSRKMESVGIGLALSKSIIELNDGIIEAESNVSEGTKIIITFIKY